MVYATDTWGRLVSTTLSHKTCINTSRQVLEKTLFAINRALMANSVFFKTLSKSIYTSNMIKGGGQGGLKRKNYRPQVSVVYAPRNPKICTNLCM